MLIEIVPIKNTYNITIKITDNELITKYTLSPEISIGRAYKHAIENHYKELARKRISELTGGM